MMENDHGGFVLTCMAILLVLASGFGWKSHEIHCSRLCTEPSFCYKFDNHTKFKFSTLPGVERSCSQPWRTKLGSTAGMTTVWSGEIQYAERRMKILHPIKSQRRNGEWFNNRLFSIVSCARDILILDRTSQGLWAWGAHQRRYADLADAHATCWSSRRTCDVWGWQVTSSNLKVIIEVLKP